jgi:YggT family protein
MALPLAVDRVDVAHYVNTLCLVYTILIFAYVISQLVLSFGVRVPYSRASDAILGFLRDTCEPYLRIFRRFIPMLGPLDITPIVAVLVLQVVCSLVGRLIGG